MSGSEPKRSIRLQNHKHGGKMRSPEVRGRFFEQALPYFGLLHPLKTGHAVNQPVSLLISQCNSTSCGFLVGPRTAPFCSISLKHAAPHEAATWQIRGVQTFRQSFCGAGARPEPVPEPAQTPQAPDTHDLARFRIHNIHFSPVRNVYVASGAIRDQIVPAAFAADGDFLRAIIPASRRSPRTQRTQPYCVA